ncbi:KAP family P-loop NTPase fold protein [Niallia sp. FSL M8-0099]|uniref:KAP family P-loop NTPase fold protein n=1 Tax=Niallia sp. FSL M8-0099 TaxID=2954519 RepID=UPI0030F510BA
MVFSNYSSDSPVNDINQDRFNRYPFAQRISEIISNRTDPSSIVIGINGAWGEGKTSVFNFIEKELEFKEHIVILKFNPWRFVSEEIMLTNFFNELARSIDKSLETNSEKLASFINKFGKPIGTIVGKGEIVDGVASFFSGADLEELRNRIEEALAKEQKRVVILIDDIDRLDKNEIHSLFRLIKLSADFQYTAYVLAFDKDVVSSALQDRYSYGDNLTGMSFLEKIIQIPLQLPLAEVDDLREFCVEDLNRILHDNKIELSDSEASDFMYYFTGGLELFFKTPRQVKLYSNILSFSIPLLKKEANIVDLMLIEGIRAFIPSVYNFIKDNREIFLTSYNKGYGSSHDNEEKSRREKLINQCLEKFDHEESEGIKKMLKYMFPKIEGFLGNNFYGNAEARWSEQQRICSIDYFQRYFSYSVSKKDVADQKVSYILDIAKNAESVIDVLNVINETITTANKESLFIKLRRKCSKISEKQKLNLIKSVVEMSSSYVAIEGFFKAPKYGEATFLVTDYIESIEDEKKRMEFVEETISSTANLDFAIDYFTWFRREREDENKEGEFTKEEYFDIGRFLISNLSKGLLEERTKITDYDISNIIYLWHTYGDTNELLHYLDGLFKKEEINVFDLLESYTPTSYNAKGDLKRDKYEALVDIIAPESIISMIHKHFPNLKTQQTYPSWIYETKEDRQLLLASQFIWLHENK